MSTTTDNMSSTLDQLLAETAWARRLAARLACGEADADEAVQDAWVAALRFPPRRAGPLRPWLARVVRNQISNRRRTDGRRQRREQVAVPGGAAPAPDELHAQLEAHRHLVGLVGALPEPYRETMYAEPSEGSAPPAKLRAEGTSAAPHAIWLRYFESLSSAEIAARLGIPGATVRTRLRTALEKLRGSLDAHHGGRQRWIVLLVPLLASPAAPPPVPPGLGPALILLLAAAVPLATIARSPARSSPEARVDVAAAAGKPSEPPPAAPAGRAHALSSCQARVTALLRERAALERTIWEQGRAEALLALGQPNPAPDPLLLPILTRIVRGEREEAPPVTLACRTFACEVRVLEPGAPGRPPWLSAIQRDEELYGHRRGLSFIGPGRAVRDAASGADLVEHHFAFGLRDPSGQAVATPQPPPTAGPADPPVATEADCLAQVHALEQLVAQRQASATAGRSIEDRYRDGRRNPRLEAQMGTIVRRVHGDDSGDLEVACHDRICRVLNRNLWASLFPAWSKPIMRWMRERGLWTSVSRSGREVHFELAVDADALLERALAAP